jgi:hypothetical protein
MEFNDRAYKLRRFKPENQDLGSMNPYISGRQGFVQSTLLKQIKKDIYLTTEMFHDLVKEGKCLPLELEMLEDQ